MATSKLTSFLVSNLRDADILARVVDHVLAPNSGISAVTEGAGLITGNLGYTVTYITADGETEMTLEANAAAVTATSNKVRVTIPVSSDARVIGRKIYRWSTHLYYKAQLITTINDNTTTTYLDNTPVGSEGATAIQVNTTSGIVESNGVRVYAVDQGGTHIGWGAAVAPRGYACTNIGYEAGRDSTDDYWMTNIGAYAGASQTTGFESVNIGYKAGLNALESFYNVNIGVLSGFTSLSSNQSVTVGYLAGGRATSTYSSAHIGYRAGSEILTDVQNTTLGSSAGLFLANGSSLLTIAENCLYVGYDSRASANDVNNEIVIGAGAIGVGSATATIGKQNQALCRIYGSLDVRTEGDAEMTFRRINSSGIVQQKLRFTNAVGESDWYLQTTDSNVNVLKVAANGNLRIENELTLQIATWHKSNDTGTPAGRFQFYNNDATLLNGYGSNPLQFFSNYGTVMNYNTTNGWSFYIDGSLKVASVGAADSGGTGYKVLRVPN
jgi:hypothetical protein